MCTNAMVFCMPRSGWHCFWSEADISCMVSYSSGSLALLQQELIVGAPHCWKKDWEQWWVLLVVMLDHSLRWDWVCYGHLVHVLSCILICGWSNTANNFYGKNILRRILYILSSWECGPGYVECWMLIPSRLGVDEWWRSCPFCLQM